MNIDIQSELLALMKGKSYTPLTLSQLATALDLSRKATPKLKKILEKLMADGSVAKVKGDRYGTASDLNLLAGTVAFRQSGGAFLDIPNPTGSIEIRPEDTGVALNGDKVLARILPNSFRPRRGFGGKRKWSAEAEGENRRYAKVIRILERANTKVVGTLRRSYSFWHVVPDDPRFYYDVIVADPSKSQIEPTPKENDKVVVRLNDWVQRHINPMGEIIENLGESHTPMAEYRAIIIKYNLAETFPPEVEKDAENVPDEVSPRDISGRFDAREIPTVTIDPEDAKDFDDAISLRRLPDGNLEAGIHIADVSRYVKQGGALDRESSKRGNSTYLVGTVIPMLPFKLSNGICSLVEDKDRLVKSVYLTLDASSNIISTRFANSVIRSSKRLSYEQAHALITCDNIDDILAVKPPENYETAFSGKALSELSIGELNDLQQMVRTLWKIASTLRARRMKAGSLDLDMPEFKIFCDKDGYADRIEKIEYNESHQLVEEYMLAANQEVSKALFGAKIPYISRVHDEPDPDKLVELRDELEPFGIYCGDLTNRREVTKLLAEISKHPQAYILKTMFLRSLKRAEYRASPDGHYGLYMRYYAHFTSPIRRYADLTVHRCIDRMMCEQKLPTAPKYAPAARSKADLEITAANITRTESDSTEAERESRKVKLMEFFERRIGKNNAFEAVITSLTNYGFFVDLTQSMAYGFVHLRTFRDDIYHLSDDGTELVGRRTGQAFRAGDKVFVDVESVDRFKRQIDFHLADCPQPETVREDISATGYKIGKVSRGGGSKSAKKPAAKNSRKTGSSKSGAKQFSNGAKKKGFGAKTEPKSSRRNNSGGRKRGHR